MLDVLTGRDGAAHRTTPAGRARVLIVCRCGLHAEGEEQGKSRAARPAGIHLAERLDPVRQLTGANKGRGEDDLTGEQAMGGGRSEQPQQGVYEVDGREPPALANTES